MNDLYNELVLSQGGELTDAAIYFMRELTNKAVDRYKFNTEEDKEDAKAESLNKMIEFWRKFDIHKGHNADIYFTVIAKSAFAKVIHQQRKHENHIQI